MAYYNIVSHAGTGKYLNLYGSSSTSMNGRNVTIYNSTGSNDQKFKIASLTGTPQVFCATNEAYALNAYRSGTNWNCNTHTASDNITDSQVIFTKVSGDIYTIRLANYSNRYMTAEGTASGANVSWQAANNATSQQWKLIETSSSAPSSFTYSTQTVGSFPLRIITTSPNNIILKNINRTKLNATTNLGINGGFFTTAATDYNCYNFAMNNGVQVGPDTCGTFNGGDCGRGAIAYHNGQLKCLEGVATLADVTSQLGTSITPTWIQGGESLKLGNSNWETGWNCGVTPSSTSTGRVAMVVNTTSNEVHLIAAITSSNLSVRQFRSALLTKFGITDTSGGTSIYKGIMLDGGGSTSLRAINSSGASVTLGCGRAVNQIIALKNIT